MSQGMTFGVLLQGNEFLHVLTQRLHIFFLLLELGVVVVENGSAHIHVEQVSTLLLLSINWDGFIERLDIEETLTKASGSSSFFFSSLICSCLSFIEEP